MRHCLLFNQPVCKSNNALNKKLINNVEICVIDDKQPKYKLNIIFFYYIIKTPILRLLKDFK